ncbi:non-homologous end-joining DNA ligase [Mesorhizobium sp. A623]
MPAKKPIPPSKRSSARFIARVVKGAEPQPFPGFIEPSLPSLKTKVPSDDDWIHELKIDGYRTQLHVVSGSVRILTRRGHDWIHRFTSVADDAASLPCNEVILDGEIAVTDDKGRPSYSALIADIGKGISDRLAFYAFDLLYLDGFDLRKAPLLERKRVLAEFLAEADPKRIFFVEHFETDGATLFNQFCDLDMEGIVCKKSDSAYRSGRTLQWIKVKCTKMDAFPIIGFDADRGPITALYLGRRDGHTMSFAGKVGTGFTAKSARELKDTLDELVIGTSPVPDLKQKEATWVEPVHEAKVQYAEVTPDGILRHASFKGLA